MINLPAQLVGRKAVDFVELRARDARYKVGSIEKVSRALAVLFEDQASRLQLEYNKGLGLGNPKNLEWPIVANMTRRIISSLSVTYARPALRGLQNAGGDDLEETSKQVRDMETAFERSAYDTLWQSIDAARNLFETAVLEWQPDPEMEAVTCAIYGPHQVLRWVDESSQSIDKDLFVALLIVPDLEPPKQVWRVWALDPDGARRCWLTDGDGVVLREQLFEDGVSPYGKELPLQVVTAELARGRIWLPVSESRVSWALAISAALNDLLYVIQTQSFAIKVLKDPSAAIKGVPEINPDSVVKVVGEGADLKLERPHALIADSVIAIDQSLRGWTLSEFMDGQTFLENEVPLTGEALKVRNRDLDQRRRQQTGLVPTQESRAWKKYVAVHNVYAARWDVNSLDGSTRMIASASSQWQPVDAKDLASYALILGSAGIISPIDFRMWAFGETRSAARAALDRVKEDLEEYPWTSSPATLVDGEPPANGTMDKVGAFNPSPAKSSDGNSLISAVTGATRSSTGPKAEGEGETRE